MKYIYENESEVGLVAIQKCTAAKATCLTMLYFKYEADKFKILSFITCFSRPCHETLFRKDSKMLTDVYCHLFKGIVDIVFVVLSAPFSFSLP